MSSNPANSPDGQPFELVLTGMAHGGTALGRHEGRVIFVPYVLPGEHILARITQDKGRFAYAEALDVLETVAQRSQPACPHFGPGLCGGCHWQHADYPAQLVYKQNVVIDQFKRIGKFESPPVLPTLPAPQPWAYRAHMTFSLNEDGATGFWADDNSRIVPIDECHILHPALREVYQQLDLSAPEVKRLRFQVGSDPADVMLVIETDDDFAPELKVDLPVSVNILMSDNVPANLIGRTHVIYEIAGRRFRATAGSFFQANPPVAEMLVEQVMSRLALAPDAVVLDLYSGVGLFAAFMAAEAELVVTIESYPPAVTDAESNVADFDNVDIIEGNAIDVLEEWPYDRLDAVVVDPPRAGLEVEVLDLLGELAPARLVYVSCDPATLARDARRLENHGFNLVDVQPVDMFPQTYHIECVALFVHT